MAWNIKTHVLELLRYACLVKALNFIILLIYFPYLLPTGIQNHSHNPLHVIRVLKILPHFNWLYFKTNEVHFNENCSYSNIYTIFVIVQVKNDKILTK